MPPGFGEPCFRWLQVIYLEPQGSIRVQIKWPNTLAYPSLFFCKTNTGHFGPGNFTVMVKHRFTPTSMSGDTLSFYISKPMKLFDCAKG